MKGIRKQFDEGLHSMHDEVGREVVIEFFKQFGINLHNNPDKYAADLMDDKGHLVEVEQSRIWDGVKAPHSEFHILGRKEDTLRKCVAYCIVSNNCKKVAVCFQPVLEKYMTDEHLHEYQNSMVGEGELMWFVPLSEIKYYDTPPQCYERHLQREKSAKERAYQIFREMMNNRKN